VTDQVGFYGVGTFFHLPDSDGKMIYLPEASHAFTLNEVIVEHVSRKREPAAIIGSDGKETDESVQARFRCYDDDEFHDIAMSCLLVVESLISEGPETDEVEEIDDQAAVAEECPSLRGDCVVLPIIIKIS
jgi:hypothetical protein